MTECRRRHKWCCQVERGQHQEIKILVDLPKYYIFLLSLHLINSDWICEGKIVCKKCQKPWN